MMEENPLQELVIKTTPPLLAHRGDDGRLVEVYIQGNRAIFYKDGKRSGYSEYEDIVEKLGELGESGQMTGKHAQYAALLLAALHPASGKTDLTEGLTIGAGQQPYTLKQTTLVSKKDYMNERVKKIRELWATMSVNKVAETLGLERNQVVYAIYKYGIKKIYKKYRKPLKVTRSAFKGNPFDYSIYRVHELAGASEVMPIAEIEANMRDLGWVGDIQSRIAERLPHVQKYIA